MALLPVHAALDLLAMWTEDRRPRRATPYRACPPGPLDCFRALPPLPPAPGRRGPWSAPSPEPAPGLRDDRMAVVATPAAGAARGTAILVPPWKIKTLDLLSGYVDLLAGAGLDVWAVVPPHHLDRAVPGLASGEGFVSPDLGAVRTSLEQLVVELRVLAALARARGGVTGVVGLSLGALAAAHAATAPEVLDFAALVAPPADPAAVFARTRIGRRYAALARRAGAAMPAPELVERQLAALRPAGRAPTARRVFVAAGRDDRIALTGPALELAGAWGVEPRLYPRGHLTLLFLCASLRRDLAAVVG